MEPPTPTFLSLLSKNDVMRRIFQELDFKAILTLRKVCQPLRQYLLSTLPDISLLSISMDVSSPESIILYCVDRQFIREIEYRTQENQKWVTVAHGEFEKNLEHPEAFSEDLGVILEHQKSVLPHFGVTFSGKFNENIYKKLEKIFKNHPIKAQNLELQITNQTQIFSIFPFFDPNSIRNLVISKPFSMGNQPEKLRIDKIFDLPQLKHLETLDAKKICICAPLEQFLHFRRAEISRETVTAEELIDLKENLFPASKITQLNINFGAFPDTQKLLDHLGPPSTSTEDGSRAEWYYRIPGGPPRILSIHLYKMAVDFVKMEPEDVDGNLEIRE